MAWSTFRAPLLLALLVILAYASSFGGVFQYDDYAVIVNSPAVHSFASWLGDLPHGIRPLLKFTYLCNWISGGGPIGYHLVNLTVHCVNALLVYLLALELTQGRVNYPIVAAITAAGIFALHPLQTESVTYICGRSVSLAALFYLGGLLAHINAVKKTNASLFVLTPLLFIAALLVKETAVTFPFALLLWHVSREGIKTGIRTAIRSQWPCWILLVGAAVAFLAHPRYGALLEYSFDIRGWGENVLSQVNAVTYLLSRLVVLDGMNIDPDLPPFALDGELYLRAGLLLGMAAAGIASLRRYPWAGFGLLWFFLHLLPTNSFVPRLDLVNDRQAYLPLAGLAIVAGGAAGLTLPGRSAASARIAAAVLCITLAIFTTLRNLDYRSEVLLWQDAARKSPGKARVHNNLGYALVLAGRTGEARAAFFRALDIDPAFQRARTNLVALETARVKSIHAGVGHALPIPSPSD